MNAVVMTKRKQKAAKHSTEHLRMAVFKLMYRD